MRDGFNLWRDYPTRPYRRWACLIEHADTPEGYRLSSYDPNVADAGFLHSLADHLRKPQLVADSIHDGDTIIETAVWMPPGGAGHLDGAVRSAPGAMLGGPRSA